jgi:hypothetical protein
MDVPTSEVGYTSATTGRGDHEVHKGYVVALAKKRGWGITWNLLVLYGYIGTNNKFCLTEY